MNVNCAGMCLLIVLHEVHKNNLRRDHVRPSVNPSACNLLTVNEQYFSDFSQTDMEFRTSDLYKNLLRKFEVRENQCSNSHLNYWRK